MPVVATCVHCKTKFKAADELLGQVVKCPKCQQKMVCGTRRPATRSPGSETERAVNRPAAGAQPKWSSLPESERQRRVLAGFKGQIEPVRVPLAYRIGILIAAFTMVVLPIIYVCLIIAVGFAVHYHLTHHTGMLAFGSGRGRVLVLMAYIAPLLAGVVMIVFMIKPLFARPARSDTGRSVTPEGEPILFRFIEQLCQTVGAPMPRRIDVDCNVNASASFRRGMLSVVLGNDLVLTIGMPFVAGLNMRQFAGVLAHEFGHFSQGAGMRLTFLVRSISMWFQRVVYERDAWDEQLEAASQDLDFRIAWLVYLARAGVWVSRGVLWCLMMVGNIVSCIMLRQMEFDADRYEARLAGSKVFESTCRRIGEISVAYRAGMGNLQQYFAEGKLTDDFPALIRHQLGELPANVKSQLATAIADSETGWFDTHPSDRDRIESAHEEQAPGVFAITAPASHLFCHWKALCKNVTWDFYRAAIGRDVRVEHLRPVDELLRQKREDKAKRETVERFLLGPARADRAVKLPVIELKRPDNPAATLARLKASRGKMQLEAEAYRKAGEALDEATDHFMRAEAARAMHRVNIVLPADLAKFGKSASEANQKKDRADLIRQRSMAKMESFEVAAGERIATGLQLLHEPAVAKRLANAPALKSQVSAILPAAIQLATSCKRVNQIHDRLCCLGALLGQVERYQSHDPLIDRVLTVAGEVNLGLDTVRGAFSNVDYPFDHAEKGISIARHLVSTLPVDGQVGLTQSVASDFLQKYSVLYLRSLSVLVDAVEQVERACGLKPAKAK